MCVLLSPLRVTTNAAFGGDASSPEADQASTTSPSVVAPERRAGRSVNQETLAVVGSVTLAPSTLAQPAEVL